MPYSLSSSFLYSTDLSPGDSEVEVCKRSVRNADDMWHKWGFLPHHCVCETCTLIFEQAGIAIVKNPEMLFAFSAMFLCVSRLQPYIEFFFL